MAEDEVDRILKSADSDGSGEIDYSEWIVATTDKKRLLTDEKLMVAFKVFDKDGGGSISSTEIKDVLGVGKNIDEKVWNEIIGEVDPNGDGEISFPEFKQMMTKLMEVEIQWRDLKILWLIHFGAKNRPSLLYKRLLLNKHSCQFNSPYW